MKLEIGQSVKTADRLPNRGLLHRQLNSRMQYTFKQKLGAIAFDAPRYEWWLRRHWIRIRNRNERLVEAPAGCGVACQWRWTSDLHVTNVFRSLGTRLMKQATGEWPIVFADAPSEHGRDVQVSFVIGHRGMQRVPHLLATLATVAAQQGIGIECIVVEQSARSEIRDVLPSWVRHVHTPLPVPDLPYCRSWTLNVGARIASGKVLVFHDNDMLVPEAYATEIWKRYVEGYEVINLKRFVFYLTENHSQEIASSHWLSLAHPPEVIVQNLEAGGSVAMTRDAFVAIGGYDESFVGWGGEDNEFWDRAQTRRVWPYAYLPIVHLWHAPQPEKLQARPATTEYYRRRSELSVETRIAELSARNFGNAGQLDPPWTSAPRNS